MTRRQRKAPDFAARLELARQYYGQKTGRRVTVPEFARTLGVPPVRYRRIARGEVEPPIAMLRAVRVGIGLSLDWLIDGSEPPTVH
jgi:transcriptional regulator with XRE-family HTH domain